MASRWLGLPRTRQFGLSLFVASLQAVSAVALLAASAWLISRAAEHPPVLYLQIGVVAVRAFALGRAVFRYIERLLSHDAAFRQLSDLRVGVFRALIPFAPAGLVSQNRAKLATRLASDVDELQSLPLRVLIPAAQVIMVSGLALVGIWWLSFAAGWALLAGLLAAFAVALIISPIISKRAEFRLAPARADLSAKFVGGLERFELLQAFGWWDSTVSQIAVSERKINRLASKSALAAGVSQSCLSAIMTTTTVATTWFAFLAVADGLQPRVLLAVIALLPLAVFDVASGALPAVSAWERYRASAGRVSEVLDRQLSTELDVVEGSAVVERFECLELLDVSITYPGQSSSAVQHFNLKLEAGETVLLKGKNGAGKSTVAYALVRFLNPSSGEYLINYQPAQGFEPDSVRKLIGYVEQKPIIFGSTLRANLLMAKPAATDAELEAVLRQVGLAELVETRKGLSTELGDLGKQVSGGQAQRISLARALLADFKVLIFDEPSSSLDDANADLFVDQLVKIAKSDPSRAVLVITHDARLARVADRVVVI